MSKFIIYLILLFLSHGYVFFFSSEYQTPVTQKSLIVTEKGRNSDPNKKIKISYIDSYSGKKENPPIVLLLHGSPVGIEMFDDLVSALSDSVRVLAPAFPGFSSSTRDISDYSVEAHALYMNDFLDSLKIGKIHIISYSMGGGVGIEFYHHFPDRVKSVTMLSAIGVQEHELLGNYVLNHSIHGAQLFGLWILNNAIPHFGLLDKFPLNVEYARNFYDTDQRPFRKILFEFKPPMLILHGENDVLIPIDAPKEHNKLVPQSIFKIYKGEGHAILMSQPKEVAHDIFGFVADVDSGKAVDRINASHERIEISKQTFKSKHVEPMEGFSLVFIFVLIAVATLVSEDLSCISAGILAANGNIGFLLAVSASFTGIFIGDILLFLSGRFFGKKVLSRIPFKWFLSESDISQTRIWFNTKGPSIIFISRFIPGMRLPTYFGAGAVNAKFGMFTFYFCIACLVWTPILVGISYFLGDQFLDIFSNYQNLAFPLFIGLLIFLFISFRIIIPLFSFKGRRLLYSSWIRLTQWEFWPMTVFYIPLIPYFIFLAIRYRSLTIFTASNPAIPFGGFIGESKSQILISFSNAGEWIAPFKFIPTDLPEEEKFQQIRLFMDTNGTGFPVVLKPDIGERGEGVMIAKSENDIYLFLRSTKSGIIVQRYIAGFEFGVFYYRFPNSDSGKIFAVTDKRFPKLKGDGIHTIEELILLDDRAVSMARYHLNKHEEDLFVVLENNQEFKLVELGTHCKGSLFLDGMWVVTPELEKSIDQISKKFEGFYFGRYDIRTPSIEDFKMGKNFKIVELNGVTSEATSIYDPKNNLFKAYSVLMKQWKIAFEIGHQNKLRGVKPSSVLELLNLIKKERHT